MQIRRYSLSNILLYVLCGLSLLVAQHIALFGTDINRDMNLTECVVFFVGLILFAGLYFFFEHKKHALKFNRILFGALILLFVLGIVASFIFPNDGTFMAMNKDGDITQHGFKIVFEQRIINIFVVFSCLLFAYLVLGVFPQKIHSIRQLNLVFYSLIIVGLIAFFYSCANDFAAYKELFAGNNEVSQYILSFTNNPNNYASFLFFAMVSSLFLIYTTKRWWFYIPAVFFLAAMIPTISRTNIILSCLTFFGFVVVRLIFTFNNHKKRNIILISVIASLLVAFIVGFVIYHQKGINGKFLPFDLVNRVLDKFSLGNNYRDLIWGQTVVLFNLSSSWGIGSGFYLFSSAEKQIQWDTLWGACSESPHNGLYQMIGNGGIVFVVFVALCLAYVIYASIRIFKKNKEITIFSYILILIFIAQMFYEAPSFVTVGSPIINTFFMSIIGFIPILSIYYHQCHCEINKEILENKESEAIVNKDNKYSKTAAFLITFIAIFIVSVLSIYIKDNDTLKRFSYILLASIFIIPAFVQFSEPKGFGFKRYLFDIVIPYGSTIVVTTLIGHTCLMYLNVTELVFALLLAFLPALYVFTFLSVPYLRNKTGLVNIIGSKLTVWIKKYCFKYSKVDNETSKLTLIEKVSSKLWFKKGRMKHEKGNN